MIGQIINIKKMYNSMADWQVLGQKLNEKVLEEIDAAHQEADTWGYANPDQQKIFYKQLTNSLPEMFDAMRFAKGGFPEI